MNVSSSENAFCWILMVSRGMNVDKYTLNLQSTLKCLNQIFHFRCICIDKVHVICKFYFHLFLCIVE